MSIQDLNACLDLKQNLNIVAPCKQFDSLNLILSIFDNSMQADLTNYNVRLRAMKADQVPLIQEHIGITLNGNVVNIKADIQLTTTAGNTFVELQFINKTTGEKKATFNLALKVVPSTVNVNGTISTATYTLLEELENKIDQCSDFFEHIDEAIEANTNLVNSTNTANETKEALDDSNITALNTKEALDESNTNATNTKNALDTLNTTANNTKDSLNTVNTTGQSLLDSLETFEGQHADVTDISNQLANVNTQLSDMTKKIFNVLTYGAKGDGITDDTLAIKNALSECQTASGILYFPIGKYIVSDVLGEITSDIILRGEKNSINNANTTSSIVDRRISPQTDFLLTISNTQYKIENLVFAAGGSVNNCLFLNNAGWEGLLRNVTFYMIYGCALKNGALDTTFENVLFNNCGSMENTTSASDVNYALEIIGTSNQCKYSNIHMEHCRFFIRDISGTTQFFNNCKFEQSTAGINQTNSMNPFYFSNPIDVFFSNCEFISINLDSYLTAFTLDTAPYFIGVTNTSLLEGGINFNNCSIMSGLGSGGEISASTVKSAKLIQSLSTYSKIIINSCNISNCTTRKSAIDVKDAIFTNNNITFMADNTDKIKGLNFVRSIVKANMFYLNNFPLLNRGKITSFNANSMTEDMCDSNFNNYIGMSSSSDQNLNSGLTYYDYREKISPNFNTKVLKSGNIKIKNASVIKIEAKALNVGTTIKVNGTNIVPITDTVASVNGVTCVNNNGTLTFDSSGATASGSFNWLESSDGSIILDGDYYFSGVGIITTNADNSENVKGKTNSTTSQPPVDKITFYNEPLKRIYSLIGQTSIPFSFIPFLAKADSGITAVTPYKNNLVSLNTSSYTEIAQVGDITTISTNSPIIIKITN